MTTTYLPHADFIAKRDAAAWASHEARIRMYFSEFKVDQLLAQAAEVRKSAEEYIKHGGCNSLMAETFEKRAGFFEAMAKDRLAMEQDAAEAFKYSTRAETWLAAREYQDDAEAIGGEGKVVQGYLMMSSVLRALAKTKKRG